MLMVHRVIDAMRKRNRREQYEAVRGLDEERVAWCAEMLERAEKFDFGVLPLESSVTDPHSFSLPELTEAERGFWRDGLIPLPAPVCWYEFQIGAGRSGLLVWEHEAGWCWRMLRIDYCYRSRRVLFLGMISHVDRRCWIHKVDGEGTVLDVKALGSQELFSALESEPEALFDLVASPAPLAIYLTLMLSSRTSDLSESPPTPVPIIKAKQRKGRTIPFAHHIVDIAPVRYRSNGSSSAEGSEHHKDRSPPRLHWRRSHLRHYDHHVPSAQWSPEIEHEGRRGWWVSVIARQLVGRAELGEVTHEYRVSSSSPSALEEKAKKKEQRA